MEQLQLFTKIIDFLLSKKQKKVKKKIPKYGCAKGQIYISADFDEPPDDF
jgi:hypothetical protein